MEMSIKIHITEEIPKDSPGLIYHGYILVIDNILVKQKFPSSNYHPMINYADEAYDTAKSIIRYKMGKELQEKEAKKDEK